MALNSYNSRILSPAWAVQQLGASFNNAAGMIIDANTEALACKYYPGTTSPITVWNQRFNLAGTSPVHRTGIFADNGSNIPDTGTQLGGYTANWALAATGYVGEQTFSSNSGALTVNTPVWLVIEYVSGTVNAGNNIQYQDTQPYTGGASASSCLNRGLQRHFNGTDWTTTTARNVNSYMVVGHADGTYGGMPIVVAIANSSRADIFVNGGTVQTQGVQFRFGTKVKVLGFQYYITKTGTPDDLTWTLYRGDTQIAQQTEVAANVLSVAHSIFWFSSPVYVPANTTCTLLATQTGTSDANDYDMRVWQISPTYIGAMLDPYTRLVYGNGTVPSALTVATQEVPALWPIIEDPILDIAPGILVHPGMAGGLRG